MLYVWTFFLKRLDIPGQTEQVIPAQTEQAIPGQTEQSFGDGFRETILCSNQI